MFSKIYFFTSAEVYKDVLSFKETHHIRSKFFLCSNVASLWKDLEKKNETENICLISFGIGEVIPKKVLDHFSLAINIHAASPEYPGRDPHHYASYDNVSIYGATAHLMEEVVDSGRIIDVELFEITDPKSSMELLQEANKCGKTILWRLLKRIFLEKKEPLLLSIQWGGVRRNRKDLLNFLRISPLSSKNEFDNRYRAFQENVPFKNLFVDLYGCRFRFDSKIEKPDRTEDFTLDSYTNYLYSFKKDYKFINYEQIAQNGQPSILWRHDVDVSVHNAYKLAEIENNLGLQATYFLMLGSWFYDIRDHEIHELVKKIKEKGHIIGLHYDFEYLVSGKVSCFQTFLRSLRHQKVEMENILGSKINVFSFHNPSLVEGTLLEEINKKEVILDMINVYSDKIKKKFKYCSDSNGLWRFDQLRDLIDAQKYPYLHVLTHPEWWTKEPYTPREKIEKALLGRARSILKKYDDILLQNKRPNF